MFEEVTNRKILTISLRKRFCELKKNEKYTSLNVKIKSNFYNITQNKQIYDTFEDAHISPNTSTRIYIFKGSFLTF